VADVLVGASLSAGERVWWILGFLGVRVIWEMDACVGCVLSDNVIYGR